MRNFTSYRSTLHRALQLVDNNFCVHIKIANRNYARNVLWRKPIRVLTRSDEKEKIPPLRETIPDVIKQNKNSLQKKSESSVALQEHFKELIIPPYEKLKKNDSRFTKILVNLKSRNRREKTGKILLEGHRLINDAIEAGIQPKSLFFSKEESLAQIKLRNPENIEICKVFYRTLQQWSGLTTCPGIMGVFKRPSAEEILALSEPVIPVTIICDNIRDPGNLGAIIRSAAASGCKTLLLTKGCVDPWEMKVLRAACGGHFRIPIINNIEWIHLANYIPKNSAIYIADNDADIDINQVPENINYDEVEEVEDEMETRYVAIDESKVPLLVDNAYEDANELECFEEITLPCLLYSSITYPKTDIVVYIGGETHGVNPRALKLACDFGGRKIKIPLENAMESLNSAFALTVILYEIRRQCIETYVTK